MNQRSIYDTILDNIENGRLKEDFSVCAEFPARNPLTAGGPGAQVNYADGAVDGIILYHIGALDLGGIGEAKLIRAVNLCSERMPEQADRYFAELGAKAGAVSAIDRLHDCIYSHRMRINPANLYNSAADIIFNSRNIESVKFAMGIIETMVKVDEQVREAIRTLALSDEFALFAIWDMLQWENGNDETFEVAKKLSGWGRIHAVKELEATRPEIKKWLFDEGIENGVMPDYSAFQVWTKAGVGEILKGDVTADGFRKIGRILDALISEEPVPGISEIENSEEAVGNFLAHAREFELDAEEYEYIFRLSKWAAREDNGFDGLAAECGDLLTTEECREAVIKAVANGKGLQMAEELGIDYADSFLKCLEENFDRQYYNVSYLTRLPDYLEPVLGIFRQNLDLPNMRA
ncbi:MAG: hypothetical protein IKY07_09575, partial [Clostridia bacterium]|nr:hypothetical protein [Clostridia bacterium]